MGPAQRSFPRFGCALKHRVAIPYKAFPGHDLVMIVYANWRIFLPVGWIIKLSKLPIMEQKSVKEPNGACKEAGNNSFIVDLHGKGIMRAGKIKGLEDAILDHESMKRGICPGSIVADDDPVLVDSINVCFSGTREPENVKGPVVQQVALWHFIICDHVANNIAVVVDISHVIAPGVRNKNRVKYAIPYHIASGNPGRSCETASYLGVMIDRECSCALAARKLE